MNQFRDAYGKNTTPEAEYQNGYMDGYVAGKEACADEIARLREALLTGACMLSEMGVSSAEKCQLAYDHLSAALAEQEKK